MVTLFSIHHRLRILRWILLLRRLLARLLARLLHLQ